MFALDTHEPQVESADGLKIWAAQAGRSAKEAPTIVFVPGFASSALLFDHQFRDEELLSKYCLVRHPSHVYHVYNGCLLRSVIIYTLAQITYEPRGQGRSDSPTKDEQWTSLCHAQDFAAVCAYYDASKVFAAGWSAGCTIISDVFEHDFGHLLAGLIYLAGVPYLELFPKVNFPTVGKYYQPIKEASTGDTHGQIIANFLNICIWKPNREAMSYTFRSALIGTVATTPTTVRLHSQTKHAQNPAKLLAAIPNYEALFIVGEQEEVVKPDASVALFQEMFPRLDAVRVPEAGHAVYWERPAETNTAIVKFVDRVVKA
ncbi:uncharacterized protein SPSK_03489 [Sporothrix schenckii 1099-18]|uniref:AB hydrolase-1 domain-containing protein n=1 Tax=Sporothrix schenckii 1099-18 TaxID=1397361 RepID=A0A0F2LX41_SPOSC|nr:uncharacterized protein SPSK_03489 [Sporothrix schenckii 1099-18]KJR82022.1 hypothetical protein SPSK_03489 [Sporothrix schenckii 1099-18]